jgi:hypothetical protein
MSYRTKFIALFLLKIGASQFPIFCLITCFIKYKVIKDYSDWFG